MIEARARQGALALDAAGRIRTALEEYAHNLEQQVLRMQRRGLLTAEASRFARESRKTFRVAAQQLERRITGATAEGRDLTFQEVQAVWERASLQLAAARRLNPDAILGAIRAPPATMLGAFESVGGAHRWQTLVKGHALRSADEANRIVRMGIAEGIGPDELARRLRPYVTGSEPFQKLFTDVPTLSGEVATLDLRSIPKDLRGAANRMRHNAERIAYTELHNARWEAEVQHMTNDPLVKAVRWRLSPFRGLSRSHVPDACDMLATSDFYGLGDGVYPLTKVPPPPHPWCRCELEPVTRGSRDAREPKPDPEQQLHVPDAELPKKVPGVKPSKARIEAVRAQTAEALASGQGLPATADVALIQRAPSTYATTNPAAKESLERFLQADGTLTPDRQALHDAIVRRHLAMARSVKVPPYQPGRPAADWALGTERPVFEIMGGGPASGKSTMLKQIPPVPNRLTINPDVIKAMLPEWRPGIATGDEAVAAFLHEESSLLAKRIVEEATRARYNILLDGTGDGGLEKIAAKIRDYKRAWGHHVTGHYVTIDTDEALRRALLRAKRSGRKVVESYLRETHAQISANMQPLIDAGYFDDLTLWDNNGDRIFKIMEARGPKAVIHDQAAWERFLSKADELPAPPAHVLRGKAAEEHMAAVGREVTAYEEGAYQALIKYQGKGASRNLNHYLMHGRLPDVPPVSGGEALQTLMQHSDLDAWAEALDRVFMQTPALRRDVIVYRGIDSAAAFLRLPRGNVDELLMQLQRSVGRTVHSKAFTSTSIDPRIAIKTFRGKPVEGDVPIVLRIVVPKGTRGVSYQRVIGGERSSLEREFLLQRGTGFRITKVHVTQSRAGPRAVLDMEVVPEPVQAAPGQVLPGRVLTAEEQELRRQRSFARLKRESMRRIAEAQGRGELEALPPAARAQRMAKEAGIAADRVVVEPAGSPAPDIVVGGRVIGKRGGYYDPVTGKAYVREESAHVGLIAHELQHLQFDTVMKQYDLEWAEVLRRTRAGETLLYADDLLRPEFAKEFPTVASLQPFIEGRYGPGGRAGGKFISGHDAFKREDAVSPYSREWFEAWEAGTLKWNAPGGPYRQWINETMSEVASDVQTGAFRDLTQYKQKKHLVGFFKALRREYKRLARKPRRGA